MYSFKRNNITFYNFLFIRNISNVFHNESEVSSMFEFVDISRNDIVLHIPKYEIVNII